MNPYAVAGIILGGLSALFVLVNQAFIFWKNVIKEDPDPARTYRSRSDCIAIHEKDRAWLSSVEETARRDMRKETGDLHDRIDTMHESMSTQFADMNTKMGNELISVSKELGEIKGLLHGKKDKV